MASNKKIKISCNNFDNKDIDSFFRDVDKYLNNVNNGIDTSLNNHNFNEKYDIVVEVSDSNTIPKKLSFKKYIKWLNKSLR